MRVDAMSKSLVVIAVVLGVMAAISMGQAFATEFNFSGQIRLRPEYRNNADFNDDVDDGQDYYGQRVRLGVEAKVSDTLRGFIQIQDTRYWGSEGDLAVPATLYTGNELEATDLHQAYVEIGNVGGMPLSLKIGRQELVYAEHRLVGNLDWSNNARAFDAIKATYKSEAIIVDLWTAKLEENSITDAAPGPAPTGLDEDIDFYGLYSMIKTVPDVPIDAYLLYRKNFAADENRYTLGARGEAKLIGSLDLMAEAAYQFGDAMKDVDASAYAFAVRAGYTLPAPWSPRVSAEYDFATGDDPDTDDESETFNQLYPTWHRHLGYADYVGWQNISAIRLGVNAKPTEKCHASIDYWLFSLAEEKDAFYPANGITPAAGFRAADPDNTEDSVGDELDLIFRHTFNPNLSVEAGYARFIVGDLIEDRIGDDAEDSDWAYLMMTVGL